MQRILFRFLRRTYPLFSIARSPSCVGWLESPMSFALHIPHTFTFFYYQPENRCFETIHPCLPCLMFCLQWIVSA